MYLSLQPGKGFTPSSGPPFNQIQNALSEIKGVCLGFLCVEIRDPKYHFCYIGNFHLYFFSGVIPGRDKPNCLPSPSPLEMKCTNPSAQPSPPTSGGPEALPVQRMKIPHDATLNIPGLEKHGRRYGPSLLSPSATGTRG